MLLSNSQICATQRHASHSSEFVANRRVVIVAVHCETPRLLYSVMAEDGRTGFYDGLSALQATSLLKNKAIGTYLFRPSQSSAGSVAIAYVAAGDVITQCLLHPAVRGGFVLGSHYDTLAAVLESHTETLKYPLQPEPEPEPESKAAEDATCPICCDASKTHALIPCGHMYCESCAAVLIVCALCKREKTATLKVYCT